MSSIGARLQGMRERWLAWLEEAPRLAALLRYAGYVAFAVGCFAFFLMRALPADRIRERVESTLREAGYPAKIGDLSFSLPAGVAVERVALTLPPANPGEKPTSLAIEKAKVNVGLLAAVRGRASVSAVISACGGRIHATYDGAIPEKPPKAPAQPVPYTGTDSAEIEVDGIDLQLIPTVQRALGIPIWGKVDLDGAIKMPLSKLAQSEGQVELGVRDFAFADGKGKVKIPGSTDPFLSQGVTISKVMLGSFKGDVLIEKGLAKLRGFAIKSADLEMQLEGEVQLRDPFGSSTARLYLKFKPSTALIERDAAFKFAVESGLSSAKREDGFYGIQLSGTLARLQAQPSKVSLGDSTSKTSAPKRPTPGAMPSGAQPAATPAHVPSPSPPPPPPPPSSPPPSTPPQSAFIPPKVFEPVPQPPPSPATPIPPPEPSPPPAEPPPEPPPPIPPAEPGGPSPVE